jgi:hypothetical protein
MNQTITVNSALAMLPRGSCRGGRPKGTHSARSLYRPEARTPAGLRLRDEPIAGAIRKAVGWATASMRRPGSMSRHRCRSQEIGRIPISQPAATTPAQSLQAVLAIAGGTMSVGNWARAASQIQPFPLQCRVA